MESSLNSSYRFEYDLVKEDIDGNTLLSSQLEFAKALSYIQKELYPDFEGSIRLKAITRGSFIIDWLNAIEPLVPLAPLLLDVDIKTVFKVFVGYLKLRKLFGGKKLPQYNVNGDNATFDIGDKHYHFNIDVLNLYKKNELVDSAIASGMKILDNDDEVKGLDVNSKDEKGVRINKKDFKKFTNPNEHLEVTKQEITVEDWVTLNVTLDRRKQLKWRFIYKENEISASILDENFLKKIEKGKRFGKGDKFKVELKIIKHREPKLDQFVIRHHEIIKILEEKPPDEQLDF